MEPEAAPASAQSAEEDRDDRFDSCDTDGAKAAAEVSSTPSKTEGADEQMRLKLEARKKKLEATDPSPDATASQACEASSHGSAAASESGGAVAVADVPEPRGAVAAASEVSAPPAAVVEDIDLSPPASAPVPAAVAHSLSPVTLPVAASSADSGTKVFRMDCGDDTPPESSPASSSGSGNASFGNTVVPPGGDLANDIRRRFQFLCTKDQKVVVKQECQMATKREDVLIGQLATTIETYAEALELSEAAEHFDDGRGPTLSPEDALKYKARIEFLRGTIAVLEAEPAVSLPKLGALEATKGLIFASYAKTAGNLKGLGDEAGVAGAASAAATGVRGALSSWFRGGNRREEPTVQPNPPVATVEGFLDAPAAPWPEAAVSATSAATTPAAQ